MYRIIQKLFSFLFFLLLFNVAYSQQNNIKFNNLFTKAQVAYLKSDYYTALESVNKCININPNSSSSYYLGAQIYLKKNEYTHSLSYINSAINIDSNNLDYYRLLFLINKHFSYINEANSVLNKLLKKSNIYTDFYHAIFFYDSIQNNDKLIETINLTEFNFGYSEELEYYKYKIYLKDNSPKSIDIAKNILYKYNFNNNLFNYVTSQFIQNNNFDSLKIFIDSLTLLNSNIKFDIYKSLITFHQYTITNDTNDINRAIDLFFSTYKSQDPIFIYNFIKTNHNFINPLNFNNLYDSIVNFLLPQINYSDYKFFSDEYSKYNRYCSQIVLLELETHNNYNYYEVLNLASLYIRFSYWYKLDSISSFYLNLYPANSKFYLFKAIAVLNSDAPEDAINYLNTGKSFLYKDSLYLSYFNFFTAIYYLSINDKDNYEEYLSKALEYDQYNCSNIIFFSLYLAQTDLNNELALKLISECVLKSPDTLSPYLAYVYSLVLFNNKDYKNALNYVDSAITSSQNPNFIYYYLKYQILLKLDSPNANIYYELSKKFGNLCL